MTWQLQLLNDDGVVMKAIHADGSLSRDVRVVTDEGERRNEYQLARNLNRLRYFPERVENLHLYDGPTLPELIAAGVVPKPIFRMEE